MAARLTLAALVAGLSAALLPASAPAEFELVNRCYLALRNNTNVTFRTKSWAPNPFNVSVPWAPAWAIAHAINPSRDDIAPGRTGPVFSSAGTLILAGGCHMELEWTSIGRQTCKVDSSSFDENAIHCYDWNEPREQFKFEIRDVRDKHGEMGGTAVVSRLSGSDSTLPPSAPSGMVRHALASGTASGAVQSGSPLRTGDLRGRGWRAVSAFETRKLIVSLPRIKLPRGCVSQGKRRKTGYQPASTAGWLFMRKHHGEEMIAGSAFAFPRLPEARQAQSHALSLKAARCLAGGVGALKGIDASARRLRFGAVGDRSSAYRIDIHETSPTKGNAELDLVSLQSGRGLAVIGFYAEEHRMALASERAAARVVAARIARG